MPVLEAVQTFAGITNENEFYSHHYLAEVFKGDIKARLDAWEAAESSQTEDAEDDRHRAPHKRLQSVQAPSTSPLKWPTSIGPTGSTMVGRSALTAAIT